MLAGVPHQQWLQQMDRKYISLRHSAAHVDGPATYVRRLDRQLPLFMIE